MSDYFQFLEQKRHTDRGSGVPLTFCPSEVMDFQRHLIEWSLSIGRSLIMADCGMGKTLMELVWAENVARHTEKPVLVLTPLAVGPQTVREGHKFGIESMRSIDGVHSGRIVVTNYERLNRFTASDFAGVVCDESGILKSFDGARCQEITEFMKRVPYRLLATATAAPNDYHELGTSSEALGYLGHMDMLNRFFKNDANNSATRRMYGEAPKWRFKGHSQTPFWRWVTSWARACRKPSDIGFSDGRFVLPKLTEAVHLIEDIAPADGFIFTVPARDLAEQREERKRTVHDRCRRVAHLATTGRPALSWCHLNEEGDLLEDLIADSVQVSGSDSDDAKEDKFLAFTEGRARVLITKPKVGAWGMNWQHCDHVTWFPSHSYEQYYQAVRRCWRFGQKNPVTVDIVMTEGETRIMQNLQRKSESAAAMFAALVEEMNHSTTINRRNDFNTQEMIPSWL